MSALSRSPPVVRHLFATVHVQRLRKLSRTAYQARSDRILPLATSEDASESGRMLFLLGIEAAANRETSNSRTELKKSKSAAPLRHPYPLCLCVASSRSLLFSCFSHLGGWSRDPADCDACDRASGARTRYRGQPSVQLESGRKKVQDHIGPSGWRSTERSTSSEQSSPDSLNSQIHGLESGPYTLQWQVLAVDGHISRGEVPFRVQ